MQNILNNDVSIDDMEAIPSTSFQDRTQTFNNAEVNNQFSSSSQQGNNTIDNTQSQQIIESPRTRSKRLRILTKNMRSSSLRRRKYKPVHCHFCVSFLSQTSC